MRPVQPSNITCSEVILLLPQISINMQNKQNILFAMLTIFNTSILMRLLFSLCI